MHRHTGGDPGPRWPPRPPRSSRRRACSASCPCPCPCLGCVGVSTCSFGEEKVRSYWWGSRATMASSSSSSKSSASRLFLFFPLPLPLPWLHVGVSHGWPTGRGGHALVRFAGYNGLLLLMVLLEVPLVLLLSLALLPLPLARRTSGTWLATRGRCSSVLVRRGRGLRLRLAGHEGSILIPLVLLLALPLLSLPLTIWCQKGKRQDGDHGR